MQFYDKFATDSKHNSMTLTADGCMARMQDDSPFRDGELNRVEQVMGQGADADERMLLNYVSILASQGLQPSSNQSLESFVIKNIALIDDYKERR